MGADTVELVRDRKIKSRLIMGISRALSRDEGGRAMGQGFLVEYQLVKTEGT